jgi:diguanylate cyclase (GGDEF)-like protein/PAS domain S-box-containing protein
MALVADSLEVGLMHLSRREGDMMRYDRVHDRMGMGLPTGTVAPLAETYCATMLAAAAPALVVEDARADPRFADKAATRLLGIGAYSGVPLYQSDGQLYGTLCALHPAPRRVQDGEIALLQLAGRIIMGAVETSARAEEALRANEEGFRLLFAANPLPMWVYDLETLRFLEVNEAAVRHYGYARDEFLAKRIDDIRPPEDVAALETLVQARQPDLQYSADWRHRLKDGRVVDVTIRSHRLTFAGRPASLVLAQDVTERKRAEEALRHQARHDSLSDLPNRTLLNERLDEALAAAARGRHDAALLLMDLDRFKEVNDTFGHHVGNLLLQRVARRLSGAVRANDTVARLGGDEFAVLLPATDVAGARAVARALLAVLDAPVELEGQALHVGASIGVALAPDHGPDSRTLLRRADVAMYAAKRAHLGHAVYDPAHDGHDVARLALAGDLRLAFARDELELHYQPQVAVTSGESWASRRWCAGATRARA